MPPLTWADRGLGALGVTVLELDTKPAFDGDQRRGYGRVFRWLPGRPAAAGDVGVVLGAKRWQLQVDISDHAGELDRGRGLLIADGLLVGLALVEQRWLSPR